MNNIGVGGYHFSYEQSDGQKRDETAELRNEGTDDEELAVTGSFSFISPDGHTYRYKSRIQLNWKKEFDRRER